LRAADTWKEKCFIADGSLVTSGPLWTLENFQTLKSLFVDNPNEGEGGFHDKLQQQIAPGGAKISQLAAEVMWLLYLFVSDAQIHPATKRDRIGRFFETADVALPKSDLFSDETLEGIARPGPALIAGMWLETRFIIMLMLEWKGLSQVERMNLCAVENVQHLCEWVTNIEGGSIRAFRHMILYFCFPDYFERICSKAHKQRIYAAFQKALPSGSDPYASRKTPCALDGALHAIRQALVEERGTSELDFYTAPLRELWFGSGEPAPAHEEKQASLVPIASEQPRPRRFWIEKTIVAGRPDRESGPHRLGLALWSPQKAKDGRNIYANMEEVSTGDVIYHFTDNEAVTGVSVVAGSLDRAFVGIRGTDWGDRPAYRIALESFQRLEPILHRKSLFEDPEFHRRLSKIASGERGRGLFYNVDLELNQGAYLTEAPAELVEVLNAAYQKVAAKPLPFAEIVVTRPAARTPYTIHDALEDLFLDETEVRRIIETWRRKKNIILQGPPGVGKSFAATRLAFALIGYSMPEAVGFVQFHQSYSYEDFVQGYRPEKEGFALKNGRFFEFCDAARQDPMLAHVFIIDEINRGNVSKIFGELMLLIEADKRKQEWQMPLAYAKASQKFFVPENVFILGLMNTADRSLAVVDYALRRRFAFFNLPPRLLSPKFAQALSDSGISKNLIVEIQNRVSRLNDQISGDTNNLGPGFAIGHSYFCGVLEEGADERDWYREIVESEILPLISEYWFDNERRVDEARELLLQGI
jgi:hypothetical protein